MLEHGGDDCQHEKAEESWVLSYDEALQGSSCEGALKPRMRQSEIYTKEQLQQLNGYTSPTILSRLTAT